MREKNNNMIDVKGIVEEKEKTTEAVKAAITQVEKLQAKEEVKTPPAEPKEELIKPEQTEEGKDNADKKTEAGNEDASIVGKRNMRSKNAKARLKEKRKKAGSKKPDNKKLLLIVIAVVIIVVGMIGVMLFAGGDDAQKLPDVSITKQWTPVGTENDKFTLDVTITNNTRQECYVRVDVKTSMEAKDEAKWTKEHLGEGWVLSDDGFCYYEKALGKDESTKTLLTDAYTDDAFLIKDKNDTYNGSILDVTAIEHVEAEDGVSYDKAFK